MFSNKNTGADVSGSMNRIVSLVDMDCFYCQVEARLNPHLQGKPMAVVQYNDWKGGGIIAVNYEARDRGVTRHMRGDEAKKICPEIELVRVATVRGKADLTKYRDASREVFNVICEFSDCVQRASIDEAYIDLTEAVDKRLRLGEQVTQIHLRNTFVVGHSSSENNSEDERAAGIMNWLSEVYDDELNDTKDDLQRLALGAVVVEEMRAAIFSRTGFKCSAGIAHNKIMAKLVAGLHKPNRQTVLPCAGVSELFSSLPVQKVRNLGGKFGNNVIERLQCKVMADLAKYSEKDLQSYFDEKTGSWLYNIARGVDLEAVTPRLVSKSIGCCKQFRGVAALKTKTGVLHWIGELAHEISERLEEDAHMNKRKAQLLTVSIQQEINKKKTATSRSVALLSYEPDAIADVAFSAIKRTNTAPQSSDVWIPSLLFLGISVGKFIDNSSTSNKMINQYFRNDPVPGSSNSAIGIDTFSDGKLSENTSKLKEVVDTVQIDKEQHRDKSASFFQRYFKNNKLLSNKSDKNVVPTDDQQRVETNGNEISDRLSLNESSKEDSHNDDPSGLFKNPVSTNSSRHNKNICGNNSTIACTSVYFDELKSEKSETVLTGKPIMTGSIINVNNVDGNLQSDVEAISLSPREIFPDLQNIDKAVLDMLPLKFQKKVLSRINGKLIEKTAANTFFQDGCDTFESNRETIEHGDGKHSDYKNAFDDSPSIPSTSVTTTAHVHSGARNNNSIGHHKSSEAILKSEYVKQKTEGNDDRDSIFKIDTCKMNKHDENFSQEMFDDSSNLKNDEVIEKLSSSLDERIEGIDSNSYKICTNCNENISIVDYQEHLDHHFAMELHQQLNSNQQQSVSSNNQRNILQTDGSTKSKKNKTPTKRKRGRPSNKKSAEIESKKPRSILSFFTLK